MSVLPLYAIALVVTGSMRGAGDTKPAMISSIIGRNILTIAFAWYLAFPMDMDFTGVWIGMAIGKLFDTIFMSVAWYRRGWFYVALKQTEIYRTHLKEFSLDMLYQYCREVRGSFMAQKGTLEIVNDDGVVYKSEAKETKFEFTQKSYSCVKTTNT